MPDVTAPAASRSLAVRGERLGSRSHSRRRRTPSEPTRPSTMASAAIEQVGLRRVVRDLQRRRRAGSHFTNVTWTPSEQGLRRLAGAAGSLDPIGLPSFEVFERVDRLGLRRPWSRLPTCTRCRPSTGRSSPRGEDDDDDAVLACALPLGRPGRRTPEMPMSTSVRVRRRCRRERHPAEYRTSTASEGRKVCRLASGWCRRAAGSVTARREPVAGEVDPIALEAQRVVHLDLRVVRCFGEFSLTPSSW